MFSLMILLLHAAGISSTLPFLTFMSNYVYALAIMSCLDPESCNVVTLWLDDILTLCSGGTIAGLALGSRLSSLKAKV